MPRASHPEATGSAARRARPPRLSLSVQCGDRAGPWPVDRAQLRRWSLAALERDAELTLRLVGLAEGRALNAGFRGRDYATNVLTFAYDAAPARRYDPVRADIVLCLPVVVREARAQRKSVRDHLGHLVVHGVLHAQGMDHEIPAQALRMEARETAILRRFRIADPYA